MTLYSFLKLQRYKAYAFMLTCLDTVRACDLLGLSFERVSSQWKVKKGVRGNLSYRIEKLHILNSFICNGLVPSIYRKLTTNTVEHN